MKNTLGSSILALENIVRSNKGIGELIYSLDVSLESEGDKCTSLALSAINELLHKNNKEAEAVYESLREISRNSKEEN